MERARRQHARRVVIAGGGIAGLELAMALRELAGHRAAITLVSPEDHFVLKPLAVREPFGGPGLERHEMAPLLERIGTEHVRDALTRVDPGARTVTLRDAHTLDYDLLAICVGGRARPAYTTPTTFWSTSARISVTEMLGRADKHPSRTLAVVIPPATTWPLPAYELALMLRRHAEKLELSPRILILTPEASPLAIFGERASGAVAARLRARDVEVEAGCFVEEGPDGLGCQGGERLDCSDAIALPRIDGPAIIGLPSTGGGFIPVDEHLRVVGVDAVYAAGDGTSFPVKQGGIAAQQAEAAAEHIAATLGAPVDPQPFRPVLRGELLTGSSSLKLEHKLSDADPDGTVSPDYLWWPRAKVGARHVAAWLEGVETPPDLSPREMPIEVEASWPHQRHATAVGASGD